MRIRLLINCRANKVLAKIIVVILDKVDKASLIMWLTKDFDN